MSRKSASSRVVLALALASAVLLAALPAQARTVRRPAAARRIVAATGESGFLAPLWRLTARLWPGVTAKEGTSIDPDGAQHHAAAPSGGSGDRIDEGTSIDPNGIL